VQKGSCHKHLERETFHGPNETKMSDR
jgi:hypothetical protein